MAEERSPILSSIKNIFSIPDLRNRVLFMLALLAIGLAWILGVGQRIAGYAGALLMIMLWSTNLPPANNPIVDEHIVYLIVFLAMTLVKPGKWLGLGKWWANIKLVKRFPILE